MNRHVSQLLGEGTAEEEMMQEREGKHEEERGDSKREPEKVTQAVEESTEPDEEETDMVQWYGDGLQ
jgi:hypothetical protein